MTPAMPNTIKRTWLQLLLVVLVCLSYLPSLSGDFILDDHPLVKDNLFIREGQSIDAYFSQEDGISQIYGGGKSHTGYYRPLINLTYYLDYRLWGMNAPGFRATNLFLHILTSLLLMTVLFRYRGNRMAAFLGALLFALHPVNSEAVAWISSRNNILAALWGLLALALYAVAWEKDKRWAFPASLLCFAAAVFSKEFGVMVLPLIFLYHRLLSPRKGNITRELAGYVGFVLVLLLYLWLRSAATGGVLLSGAESGDLLRRITYAPYLLLLNLGLSFFPHALHSFIVGYPDGSFTWQGLAGWAGLCLFGLLLWMAKKRGISTFGLAGFLLMLLPVLNILPTSAVTLVSMRWLYFPILLLTFALTDWIDLLLHKSRNTVIASGLVVAAYLGITTWSLNAYLWHDEWNFFREEVLHFRNLHYAGGLAEKLLERKQYEEAEKYFQVAVSNSARGAKDFINYAALLIDVGRPGEALSLLDRARSLSMTVREGAEWANNAGMALFAQGKVEEAIWHMRKAVETYPGELVFWANLGAALGSAGDLDASEETIRKGLELHPDSDLLRKNLAVTLAKKKEAERARVRE